MIRPSPNSGILKQSEDRYTSTIAESEEFGLLVLSPKNRLPRRRILFVNSYGGRQLWESVKIGKTPPHHLWGCIELVWLGYEIMIAEPLKHLDWRRSALSHDLPLVRAIRHWLGSGGILYCAHTLLYWVMLLKRLGLIRSRVASLIYAGEDLDFATSHDAILALTPAAFRNASRMAPKVPCVDLGWGIDADYFPKEGYDPEWFLNCGRTHRDFSVLADALRLEEFACRIVTSDAPKDIAWPKCVTITSGGKADDTVPYSVLINEYYGNALAGLVLLNRDDNMKTAVGFTSTIECMAMSKPAIVTRTGALPEAVDVEKLGCGLFVEAGNSNQLVDAMRYLKANRSAAEEMGRKGRQLAETRYGIRAFSERLHEAFERL